MGRKSTKKETIQVRVNKNIYDAWKNNHDKPHKKIEYFLFHLFNVNPALQEWENKKELYEKEYEETLNRQRELDVLIKLCEERINKLRVKK